MQKETISLAGQWRYLVDPDRVGEKRKYFFPEFGFSTWQFMNVPSNWQTAGLDNYSGVVWFKTSFPTPKADKEIYLKFAGVDYFAKVWLNGQLLGEHEGYFQPFEFNITKKIKPNQENILVVKVDAPAEDTNKVWPNKKKIIKGVFGHHDIRPGSWSPEYGQSMGTGGIWNNVELEITDKVRILDVKITPQLSKNYTKGTINIDLVIENKGKPANKKFEINIHPIDRKLDNTFFIYKTKLKTGKNKFRIQKDIVSPLLWWCWDHGEQNLYEIDIAGEKFRFGFREIIIDDNKAWHLNGRKIFIRGTNIIPEEYLSTYTRERIAKDLKMIKDCNVNAIRVHAHINKKELYDLCDETGLLVWQDFALQWEYDQSDVFKKNAVSQIKDMVELLYNNPSIAAWNCHNEPSKSKDNLDKALAKAVLSVDKTRPVFDVSDFCEHPYPGWFWGSYKYYLALPGKSLPSEFGAQALPNIESLKKIFKDTDIWPPNWSKWAYHNFTYEQTFHIAQVNKGASIEEFISNSQEYQRKLLKFAIETYRIARFNPIAGLFQFMFFDPWPCISYSVVDYFRSPKKGFYALRTAYQPVLLCAALQRDIFGPGRKIEGNFWIINDLELEFKGARVKILLTKNNETVFEFPKVNIDIEKNYCKEITNKVYFTTKDLLIPDTFEEGNFKLIFKVFDGRDRFLSENWYEIRVEKIPAALEAFNAQFNI